MRVYVEGTLVQRTWQSRETGEDREGMELEVDYLALDPSRIERIELRASSSSRVLARANGAEGGEVVQEPPEPEPDRKPRKAQVSK